MSYLSPTNSLDDIDYDEMEDVTDVFERHHLDGNGDYQGISGEDNQMDQGPYDADDYSDLPSVLIVTGVPECVYEDQSYRNEFESLFKAFEPMPEFYYLKCFRRARVVYESSNSATHARIQMHERYFHGSIIKCYFAQMPVISDPSSSSPFLLPPKPDKQFLISPPSSPPVGWESVSEKEPVINYDLLAAIANLAPGESHEIHAASDRLPGIVVHVCEDPEGFKNRPRLLQTSCPHPSTERALGNLCIRVNGCPALQGFERKDQFPYDDVKTVGEHLVYIVITSRETGRDRWLYTEPVWYESLSGVVSCPEDI